jgi:hypothetical protein
VVGRDLEETAVGNGHHAVESPRRDVEDITGNESLFIEVIEIGAGNEIELAIEYAKGLDLDLVILETERFALANTENLADIVRSLSKNLFVTPGLLYRSRASDQHLHAPPP